MDPMQQQHPTISHIVQVYQSQESNAKMQNPQILHISHPSLQTSQGKLIYQQTITSKSVHIPVSTHISEMQNPQMQLTQNQIVMSCPQMQLHDIPHMPAQMTQIQHTDMSQPLQVLLPQVPMVVSGVQQHYYNQYDNCEKAPCIVAKAEPDVHIPNDCNETIDEYQVDKTIEIQIDAELPSKKSRSQKANPSSWACNVRKLKHQRGEAYVSLRGKYVPERKVKTIKDCLQSCKYKCSERITDTDREHIFKAFYSLNANEKRHFLLNTTERNTVKHQTASAKMKRQYSFKYFFIVRAVRHTVCKLFYLGTLAISQKPVYNVHLGKSEMNIPKPDGRGLSVTSARSLPSEVKDRVRQHILSFNTEDSKAIKPLSRKKQYLGPNLSIKEMYVMYCNDCHKDNVTPVKMAMYRKIFKQEFNLHFRKSKTEQQICCKCKGVIRKK